jgi:hypothetical protein
MIPNPYEASVVKRAAECTTGVEWPSAEQVVNHPCQALAADFISVAGHSLRLYQTPIEGRCSPLRAGENSGSRKNHALETLLCPRPGLLIASGLCRKTLLVSARLGGGAATAALVTSHQGDERERPSNHGLRLRALCPATPSQSQLYIRKESAKGSALDAPVRPRARSLPSAVTW